MKRGYSAIILFIAFALLLASFVTSESLTPSREQKLKYGLSLYILDASTNPSEIEPGSDAVITLKLQNVAPHALRDVVIELELPTTFAPRDITKKKIRDVNGSEIFYTNFGVIALPNSQEGIYKIPLKISYLDEIGTEYKENNTISLKISAKPKIFVGLASSEIYEGNLLGKISIRIANTGVGDIKFLIAEILPSQDYEVIDSDRAYVGEIPSDDYETVSFKLDVKKGKRDILLPITLSYTDANNKEYTENVNIPLTILSAKEAGIKQNNSGFFIFGVIGILILYFSYRQLRRKLKKRL